MFLKVQLKMQIKIKNPFNLNIKIERTKTNFATNNEI
jgi:hypothetical protein